MRYLQLGSNLSQLGPQFQGQGPPTSASNDHKILSTVLQQRRTRKHKQQAEKAQVMAPSQESGQVIKTSKRVEVSAITSTKADTSKLGSIPQQNSLSGQQVAAGDELDQNSLHDAGGNAPGSRS